MISQKRPLRILLHSGGWTTNIGNAFLQLGAEALLRAALPSAEIYLASALPRWFLSTRIIGSPSPHPSLCIDTIAYGDYDVFVSAGMVLCREFIDILGDSLATAARRGTQVLFLGAGALEYTEQERSDYMRALVGIPVIGFCSRDPRSFQLFGEHFESSMDGIDCAWWLPEAYTPLSMALANYRVISFHDDPEPEELAKDTEAVRTHHYSFERIAASYTSRGRILISDRPEDYLNLYASAAEVHTDRVHATVATLVYGRPCKLYSRTPRASLFEAVGASDVTARLHQMNVQALVAPKARQVEWVRATIARFCANRGYATANIRGDA